MARAEASTGFDGRVFNVRPPRRPPEPALLGRGAARSWATTAPWSLMRSMERCTRDSPLMCVCVGCRVQRVRVRDVANTLCAVAVRCSLTNRNMVIAHMRLQNVR